MDLNSLSASFATQGLLPSQTESRKKNAAAVGKGEGDTVSISDEAKAMLARMTASFKPGNSAAETENAGDQDGASAQEDSTDAGEAAGGAGGGGGGGGDESASKIESIEAQIKSLQSQYQSVMQGSGDPDIKEVQGKPIQQQIVALEQQLNDLKMNALKKA